MVRINTDFLFPFQFGSAEPKQLPIAWSNFSAELYSNSQKNSQKILPLRRQIHRISTLKPEVLPDIPTVPPAFSLIHVLPPGFASTLESLGSPWPTGLDRLGADGQVTSPEKLPS